MSLGKVLAKEFTWKIDDGTDTGTYIEIKGLNNISPSTTKNDADISDFNDDWLAHLVASRGLEFTIEGYHIEDASDGSRDPGQEQVEAAAEKVGAESLVPFQIQTPGGTVIDFEASVDAPPFGVGNGGGNEDAAGFTATLTVSGKPTVT